MIRGSRKLFPIYFIPKNVREYFLCVPVFVSSLVFLDLLQANEIDTTAYFFFCKMVRKYILFMQPF